MENKRTEELRRMHASVKAKLMSAIAMLLVATIMMSSTTYAWFVLSTAPEVKGMSTTVGANGALEIALMDDLGTKDDGTPETFDEALNSITSGVGDSSAYTKDVTVSNITWGNIVDLAGDNLDPYGMNNITLYPAALNLKVTDGVPALANAGILLMTPVYGTDGRVANLEANTYAGKKDSTSEIYMYDANYYGVRAIGKYTNADPVSAALLAAQSGYANAVLDAQSSAANKALSKTNASALTRLLVKYALQQNGSNALNMTLTQNDLDSIKNTVAGLKEAAGYMATAIKYAIIAEDIVNKQAISDLTVDNVTLNAATYPTWADLINKLNALNGNITSLEGQLAAITADSYSNQLDALFDLQTMRIGGLTIDEIQALEGVENWATGLLNDAVIESNGVDALLVQTANMMRTFSSSKFTVQLDDDRDYYTMEDATIKVNLSISGEGALVASGRIVSGYTASGGTGAGSKPTIQPANTYGYVVDLAFRASVDTDLQLSAAQSRVAGAEGEDAALVQGTGSNVTITSDLDENGVADLANALRVVFYETNDLNIVGVATMSTTPTEEDGNVYDLLMHEYVVDAVNGGIAVDPELLRGQSRDAEGNVTGTAVSTIMSLEADTPTAISVLVYLDGNYVDSAFDGATAKLNLQFSSSEDLTPMNYSGYISATTDSSDPSTESSEPDETT